MTDNIICEVNAREFTTEFCLYVYNLIYLYDLFLQHPSPPAELTTGTLKHFWCLFHVINTQYSKFVHSTYRVFHDNGNYSI